MAQHLEAIEADMLEREAAFAQAQRERDALQEALRSRGHNPTVALQSVADGDVSGETLTNELDVRRLQNDVRRKQAHIAVLEHEQAELMKRWPVSFDSKTIVLLLLVHFLTIFCTDKRVGNPLKLRVLLLYSRVRVTI